MYFNRKCWFDLFKEQFISLFNFELDKIILFNSYETGFSVRLPVTNACNRHSLYTAFFSNVRVWGMWACSIFFSFIYLSLEKGVDLHWNKLESNAFCQVWVKLTQWLKFFFSNFVNTFLLFHNHISLEKSVALYLKSLDWN